MKVKDLSRDLVQPLSFGKRRELAMDPRFRDLATPELIATVRVDGTHVAVSARNLPDGVTAAKLKSPKPNSKYES